MKVIHIIAEMGAGGAESLVAQMARGGVSRGWTTAVASAGGMRADELALDTDTRMYTVGLGDRDPRATARSAPALRRALVDFSPEVIIAHNVRATVAARLALLAARRRPPIISVFHGVRDDDYRWTARALSYFPDAVVAVSEAIMTRLVKAGLRHRHTSVIRNAIELSLPTDRNGARASLGLPLTTPIALCVARISPQKRHDVLLAAWQYVPEPKLLLLAGDGPERPDIERRINRLGLSASVRLLGVRRDIPVLLAACDITCLASDWEGLPISLLESMAAGRPVIATRVDGVEEAVGDAAGLLVPRRDPVALGEALTKFLHSDDVRAASAAAAFARVRSHYDPESMMAAYQEVFISMQRLRLAGGPTQ